MGRNDCRAGAPEPEEDVQALEAVLRPDSDGHSRLQRARKRYGPFLREVREAKPADVDARPWRRAIEGLESFLFSGWADEALRLGWPHDELFRVPSLWSRVDLCGAALLIGDREVVNITSTEIRIKTASGSTLAFYRKPQVDYGVAYRARIKMAGEDARKEGREEEVKLHALEAVARLYLSHHSGADIDTAKAAVLAAIKEAAP
jgi:hypothetical protein